MLGDTGEYLEVVRQVSTGLFMIRIDHLDVKTVEDAIQSSEMADKLILPDKVLEELEEAFKMENAEALAAEAAEEAKVEFHPWIFAGCDKEEPSPRACMHTRQPVSHEETQKLARCNSNRKLWRAHF